jgi:simple sugar transport system substrate-binding protein
MSVRTLIVTLASGALLSAAPAKIGFVYMSPIGDEGWTYQHELGRKQMVANLGGQVTTQVVEDVAENSDADRVIRELAASGCRIVFTTSFGYMNQTLHVAQSFPNVAFFHATGYKTANNMGIYNARFYEGRYLNGVIAGKMTKTHLAGYVAAFPIPEVMMGINAFAQGMRSVDPKAEVRVVWLNSWFDPGKEREATLALISQNCDMITHHMSSPAVAQTVEAKHKEKGVWCFSYHSDMSKYAPTSQLSGTTHVWGDFYTRTVKEVLAGKWTGTNVWGGFKEGMIKLAPLSPAVPADVRTLVGKLQGDFVSGKLHPFQGPVIAQDGTVKVAAGQVMTDSDLGAMNYYVQGVNSTLPR